MAHWMIEQVLFALGDAELELRQAQAEIHVTSDGEASVYCTDKSIVVSVQYTDSASYLEVAVERYDRNGYSTGWKFGPPRYTPESAFVDILDALH